MPLASVRTEIAGFLESLIFVYVLIIIAYIVTSLIFSFGVRVPYSRPLNAVLGFLRDVAEPWLRIFRRLPLRIGPLDLTPIVAILALQIGGNIIVTLVRG
jgi:YggT family protein